MSKPELVFISPRFLFPAHSGGAIRTGQILRGMKGGRFRITLLSPAQEEEVETYRKDLEAVADEFHFWRGANPEDRARLPKAIRLLGSLPVSVAADRLPQARTVVAEALARRPSVVVADFAHSAILLPVRTDIPSVMFTHNCEAEIYERHAEIAERFWMRILWRDQARKMRAFERFALNRFNTVIAVAERDAVRFRDDYGVPNVESIPTGVDLDFFRWTPPDGAKRVVFTGSMDWLANVDGIEWMMDEVWPLVIAAVPEAEMTVVGKAPSDRLLSRASKLTGWRFAGRVPDIRPHLAAAAAYVIPLRIGGGTRIKAFEAMAAGVPVVSTALGVEGLGVEPDRHYLCADGAEAFASAVVRLLQDTALGTSLSRRARQHVELDCSNAAVARRFESICELASNKGLQRGLLGADAQGALTTRTT